MKHRLDIRQAYGILVFLIFLSLSFSASAQYKRKGPAPQKEARELKDRLWFGLNVGNIGFGANVFNINLAPMAGVEIIDAFSLGLMFKIDYFYERYRFSNVKFTQINLGPTVFARYRLFNTFFIQAEYERLYGEQPLFDSGGNPIVENNRVVQENIQQNYVYLGGGYSAGDRFRYEISIHYNVLDDIGYIRIPWDYRAGFTFSF